MHTRPFLCIALAVAGVTTAPRESGRMGWCPCSQAHLFVFPPPLVAVELGHVCDVTAVSCRHHFLCQCPAADLKLVHSKGHDKLDVGVT
jgi:hypothetical protein